ncbi:MAG TPA: transcriptional regulator [Candidatus Bathyarchaeia archaeon]|nr:transcriptional regulator [Candidatus Bathyarchaeia archaeon]
MGQKEIKERHRRDFLKHLLLEELQDPEFVLTYLNESLTDEDERVFLLALKDVVEARGEDISSIAKKANLSHQEIHRMLSAEEDPRLTSVRSLLHALNLELAIQSVKK